MNINRLTFIFLITNIFVMVVLKSQGQFASGVSSYLPAPGQYTNADFIGTPTAANSLTETNKGLVSLGSFGGSIVLHFSSGIKNDPNNPYGIDFTVYGNATFTWSEPGIIQVMKDENKNGLPDDTWLEIAGSDHFWKTSIPNYEVTYCNSGSESATDIQWTDNAGNVGIVPANSFHRQSYYPKKELFPDVPAEKYTLRGTRLEGQIDLSNPGVVNSYRRTFGYADNTPVLSFTEKMPDNPYTPEIEGSGGDAIDIDWAVNQEGKHIELDEIHFIRIYTGMNAIAGWLGEISTEITGIRDVEPVMASGSRNVIVIQDLAPKLKAGANYPVNALFFESGKKSELQRIRWSVDHPEMAIVENGWLKTFKPGKIRIKAYATDNPSIYAEKELELFSVGKAIISLTAYNLKVRDRIALSGKFTDQNGNVLAGITPVWRVDNKEIAEVFQSDGLFYLRGKSTGKCWLYFESDGIHSIRDSVSIQVLPESVLKKVYVSVKTEEKTLVSRQSLWVETFDLTPHVNRAQKSYQLNDTSYVSLAHVVAAIYKNTELKNDWAFRDDAEGGNSLYLWRVPEEEEGSVVYHLGYGGSRSGTIYRKTWIVMHNQNMYVTGFDKVKLNNDDEILIFQINDNLIPWSVTNLTTGSDTLKLNEQANLQLMRYSCTMRYDRSVFINSSEVLAFQNVQLELKNSEKSGSTYRTDEFGKLTVKMDKAGDYLFVSGIDESRLFVETATKTSGFDSQTSNYRAFPNPFTKYLYLENHYFVEKVEVFDLQGRMVYTERNPASSIDLSTLSKGIYLLKIISENGFFQQKLIKN